MKTQSSDHVDAVSADSIVEEKRAVSTPTSDPNGCSVEYAG
jgi:hypothetical protein